MKDIWTKFTSVNNSIQAKIFIAFSIVILFALTTIGTIIYFNLTNSIKNNAITYVTESIRHADESLGAILEDVDHIGSIVVTNQSNVIDILRSDHYEVSYDWFLEQKQIVGFLSSLIAYKSSISRISIVGVNGKIFSEGSPYMDKTNLNHPLIERILSASGKKVYIRQSAEETGRDETVTFGRSIKFSNQPIGVVMIDIQYDVIKNAYDIRPSEDSFIYVVDANGEFVYHSNSDIPQDSIINRMRGTNLVEELEIDGVEHLIVTYTSDITGWTTIGMIPEHTLIKDSISLRNQIVQVVLLVFVVVLIVSIAVTSRITKNLRKLRNTMLWVQEGNFTVLNSIQSKDEVGQLSLAFQDMLEKVRTLVEDVKSRERQKREAELMALQAQIRPHFLYNSLNTIKYLAKLRNAANIEEVSTSLIELLRGVLGNAKEFVTIEEELDYVQSYINIQKYKYIEPFVLNIQVDPALMSCKIVKLTMQPIVENAIIHGIGPLKEKGLLNIKIQRDLQNIRIEVTDNGNGMSEDQIENVLRNKMNDTKLSFNGMGISNVQERIKMMFGDSYGLKVYSEPGMYTTVEMIIPYVKEGDEPRE